MSDLLRHVRPLHDSLAVSCREDRPLDRRELADRDDGEVFERADHISIRLDDLPVLDLREVRHIARNVPRCGTMEPHMSPSADAGLRVRALSDQAVAAALDADWTRAVELNAKILEAAPDDIEARNRIGRAYIEQGKLEEAKASFAEVLKAEPYNSIAIRGTQRTTALLEHHGKSVTTKTKTQPRLFIEDMGKTGILRLMNPAPPHVLFKYSPGADAELRESDGLIAVHARDGELLGFLEPKVGRRLIDLIRTGNQYVAAMVSNDQANARVAIREVFQSAENTSRISFPGTTAPRRQRSVPTSRATSSASDGTRTGRATRMRTRPRRPTERSAKRRWMTPSPSKSRSSLRATMTIRRTTRTSKG